MKKVIFDTNIYGNIAIEDTGFDIAKNLSKNNEIIIYGSDIIEEELQRVPEEKTLRGRKFKEIIHYLYYTIIKYRLKTSPLIDYLAEMYLELYKDKIKKEKIKKDNWKNILVDFRIVALASLKNLDVVFSNDDRTMTSNLCIKIYKKINKENSLRTPEFLNYLDLKKRWFQ
mgnify:CR=1 FL=1